MKEMLWYAMCFVSGYGLHAGLTAARARRPRRLGAEGWRRVIERIDNKR